MICADGARHLGDDALNALVVDDAVIVGMFPKYSDQVTENVSIVRKLLQT